MQTHPKASVRSVGSVSVSGSGTNRGLATSRKPRRLRGVIRYRSCANCAIRLG